jgi:hypothetical protein
MLVATVAEREQRAGINEDAHASALSLPVFSRRR